jgi:hypothetical protein
MYCATPKSDKHTKNSVAKVCESVQIREQITPFVLLPSFKINVLPTGSPTLFGVKNPEVSPIKTDLIEVQKEILCTLFSTSFHFIASKNQLSGIRSKQKNKYFTFSSP